MLHAFYGGPVRQARREVAHDNTHPTLPLRTGEDVLLWFTPGERPTTVPEDLARHLKRAPPHLRPAPVAQRT